jgi:hypothetical protein
VVKKPDDLRPVATIILPCLLAKSPLSLLAAFGISPMLLILKSLG